MNDPDRNVGAELGGIGTTTVPMASLEFARAIGHAVQTPMYSLLGFAELLADSGLDPEQLRMLEGLIAASDSLRTILQGVLDYCRVASGGRQLDRDRFDPRQLVREVVVELAPEAKRKQLELRLLVADELPAEVVADRSSFELVLRILVDNAIAFTERGRIKVGVGVERDDAESTVMRVVVSDTGVGISRDDLVLLFEPALRAPRPDGVAHLGLSLALARHLARQMQGDIEVNSVPGTGSTFALTLGVDKVEEMNEVDEAEVVQPTFQSSTVLVVEDNEVNRELAIRQLRRIGYETVVATNGREAIDLVRECRFGAVLMDCRMPELDGLDATREIRDQEPAGVRVPIIAMTANAMKGDREACIAAGMDDYLAKPVDLATLRSALFRWVPLDARTSDTDSVDAAEVVHQEAVDELLARLDGDRGAFATVVDAYLAELQVRRLRIVAAARAGDADDLARVCHALGSASASLGVTQVRETCDALAADAPSDGEAVNRLLAQLKNECEAAAAALHHVRDATCTG